MDKESTPRIEGHPIYGVSHQRGGFFPEAEARCARKKRGACAGLAHLSTGFAKGGVHGKVQFRGQSCTGFGLLCALLLGGFFLRVCVCVASGLAIRQRVVLCPACRFSFQCWQSCESDLVVTRSTSTARTHRINSGFCPTSVGQTHVTVWKQVVSH